jgi:hypothetical protein
MAPRRGAGDRWPENAAPAALERRAKAAIRTERPLDRGAPFVLKPVKDLCVDPLPVETGAGWAKPPRRQVPARWADGRTARKAGPREVSSISLPPMAVHQCRC